MNISKYAVYLLFLVSILMIVGSCTIEKANTPKVVAEEVIPTRLLRHVVLFKFKDTATAENIASVGAAFSALPSKIPQIYSYEWGLNNSPEGLEKGFTHCFLLTFKSEEDRAIYLPHPDHKAFGELLGPYLEDVLVVDYWAD